MSVAAVGKQKLNTPVTDIVESFFKKMNNIAASQSPEEEDISMLDSENQDNFSQIQQSLNMVYPSENSENGKKKNYKFLYTNGANCYMVSDDEEVDSNQSIDLKEDKFQHKVFTLDEHEPHRNIDWMGKYDESKGAFVFNPKVASGNAIINIAAHDVNFHNIFLRLAKTIFTNIVNVLEMHNIDIEIPFHSVYQKKRYSDYCGKFKLYGSNERAQDVSLSQYTFLAYGGQFRQSTFKTYRYISSDIVKYLLKKKSKSGDSKPKYSVYPKSMFNVVPYNISNKTTFYVFKDNKFSNMSKKFDDLCSLTPAVSLFRVKNTLYKMSDDNNLEIWPTIELLTSVVYAD